MTVAFGNSFVTILFLLMNIYYLKLTFVENKSKCGVGQQKVWEACIFSEAEREGRVG